ncbi:dorsal isoform X1 [Megachile rotundata]|uniref:dorsal isoform X1 n=1 Tax=Megachile rotundata TaxID=143995 RepID=UPI000614C697|nr:PREDICTED: embryonic polarity protein dorsal-like isoform X1 [Megachile rotundata]XP_012152808.1 PREDICTED: embryonic polarity protein dorsal-like isoform X1 [Megachile rotundata]XP_012152809.1 PREDICTED: embryonic polarity protein dorsal-like isoform X1 [Megachile rotundata]XP_012152810.1 PREDICTED: embryonic polarity protein dorsal-like isoform X1 [Megachile rotundata]XP_012152811.1 PREDICTED: embryonic polarity protein dorsal-like isoform X1 [Megachile rotundata]XP_012152812.1 PREDICTED:
MESFHGMSDENIHISDVMEVIGTTDPGFAGYTDRGEQPPVEVCPAKKLLPYIEIIEQPASKALRFRYECEGRSAGSIPGVNSTPENKTFPSIRIVNHNGPTVVIVSCVTKDEPYRPHPHNLVGKEACKQGVCTVEVSSKTMTVTFANLGIQCVKRKDIEEALRIREAIRVDPFRTGFEHKRQPTSIDLNAVRLCFQGFIEGSQKRKFNVPLAPVVSDPIFDKKAMSDLVICKLSHSSASVAGGMEMILLCEKVAKEDIQVRFFEEKDGQLVWEGFGDFQPTHVHKQTAIAFRTPTYRIQQVDQPVQVYIQLKRPSDGATSEPLPFQMLPLGAGRPAFWSLRKAFAKKKTDYSTFGKILATESTLLSNVAPKLTRNIDEFNNNDFGLKKSNNKISALRALNDLYNVRNTLDSCNGSTEIAQNNAQNMDHLKSTIIDYENNEVPIHTEKVTDNDQINKIYKIDSNYANKETNDSNSGTLTRVKPDSTVNNTCVLKNLEISKNRSDWFDYSEVGKWVQKGQLCLKEKDNEADLKPEIADDCNKSFNELLTQVAELDQIYADTHAKLIQAALEQSTTDQSMDIDVCDNQTYTSLQMAMKNPVEFIDLPNDKKYEDVCISKTDPNQPCPSPPVTTKRDGTQETEERLPPLPPKRIRKMPSMPLLPRPISSPVTTDSYIEAPNKNLPSLPGTLSKTSKQGLFSKLFAKKIKKDKDTISNVSKDSNTSVNIPGNASYFLKNNVPDGTQLQSPRPSATSTTSVKSLRLDGDDTPPYGMELTEAEHYALYTAMAPHATVSEFDEMSFYYSPVEGGKIFSEKKDT